ncbi:hypothetical protein [Nocardia tengchongensis]|uniref:hypothetical protein n=1 Tax=Nocardia tengchongensis TaxID=2055889 RepID=UPI00367519BC
MLIILAATLFAPLLFAVVTVATRTKPELTVADIQARLAAEPPRTYVPISRGW